MNAAMERWIRPALATPPQRRMRVGEKGAFAKRSGSPVSTST